MKYFVIPPSPLLSNLVRYYWVYEGEGSLLHPFIHRSMADGCMEIVFHYKGQFTNLEGNSPEPLSSVFGQSLKFSRYQIRENFGIFGVYLYPYALTKLIDLPAYAMSNQTANLEVLFGEEGKELEDKILLGPENLERVKVMNQFFEKKLLHQNHALDRVQNLVKGIIDSAGQSNTLRMAEKSCLSVRQFQRKFKEYAGFSPKTYNRLIRYSSTLSYYGDQIKSLGEIASECGYYDQAHFINDFKDFTGYNPKSFFAGLAEGMDYRNL